MSVRQWRLIGVGLVVLASMSLMVPPSAAQATISPFGRYGLSLDRDSRALTKAVAPLVVPKAIRGQPLATWLSGGADNVEATVRRRMSVARRDHAVPVLVMYNLPHRDCGAYSTGGVSSSTSYRAWVRAVIRGLGKSKAIVVIEPDALSQVDCLTAAAQNSRYNLLAYDISKIAKQGSWGYLDAGHSGWIPTAEMALRLIRAGVANAAGFSVNVSNFRSTASSTVYGNEIATVTGKHHFVIDTSRNGAAVTPSAWCNPLGQALGHNPTVRTGNAWTDAWLWIKTPGLSDGSCDGAPLAGAWFASYAQALVANRARLR